MAGNQTRNIRIWNQANITFSGSGVTLGSTSLMTIDEQGANGEILVSTDWDDTDQGPQFTTEQLAFEDREVITNRFVGGRTVSIEYNMQSNPNTYLDETKELRKQSIKGMFSLSRQYSDSGGVQRTEAFKDCLLQSFTFTPQGQNNYNVKMSFKVLDSRKYVTPRTGSSYRSL